MTVHAIASFDAPYLSTVDRVSAANFPRHPPGYEPNISRHLLDCCRKAEVKETLTDLVESALVLIADLNAWFADPRSPLDPLDIQNYACVLECLLLNWSRDHNHPTTPLEDAICVALLIFAVRVTEAFQRQSDQHSLHFVASKRLAKALKATSRYEWCTCPELLLWILAVGTISAEGSSDHPWFMYQLSIACNEFGIVAAESLLARLHCCGWVSFKLDQAVQRTWEGIVKLRLEDRKFVAIKSFAYT